MYPSIQLQFTEGRSDKVYHARIEPDGPGFRVNFAYGRRGNALTTGTKTSAPVSLEEAETVFNQLVGSKVAKGYRPVVTPGTASPVVSVVEPRDTGIRPQLLNPVEEPDLDALLESPDWWMQEKLDGRRCLLRKSGETITGINRRGLEIPVPEPVMRAAQELAGDYVIDGELVGDVLHVFDLLEVDDLDHRAFSFARRLAALLNLLFSGQQRGIRFVDTFSTYREKLRVLADLRERNAEGVVIRDCRSTYTVGRPNSGGPALKFKFVATATCIVHAVNPGKRSVSLVLNDKGKPLPVGNVTIPPNHRIPDPTELVEIRYLYAFAGGSLYQPVYLGPRDDQDVVDCTTAQLKFKPEIVTC